MTEKRKSGPRPGSKPLATVVIHITPSVHRKLKLAKALSGRATMSPFVEEIVDAELARLAERPS